MLKKSIYILILLLLYRLPMKRLLWLLWRAKPARFRYFFGVVYLSRKFFKQDKFALSFSFCKRPKYILCVNDRINGHGLTDRLRGMVSLYSYCKDHSLKYGIVHTHPFRLEDYLCPNYYDWTRYRECYRANSNINCVLICEYPMSAFGWSSEFPKETIQEFEHWVLDIFTSLPVDTLQVVTNASFAEKQYGELFRELFKPTDSVLQLVEHNRQLLGNDYVSVSYRFLNLLGDSDEHIEGFQQLDKDEVGELICKCQKELRFLMKRHNCSVLVTSDSYLFLSSLSCDYFPRAHYILRGKVHHHMGLSEISDSDGYLKSFAEMFLISNANMVYQVIMPKMYNSTFPRYSAILGNRDYKVIYPNERSN